jgi:CRISPR/Cas system Type II protein with McrA/HNH and RuvC-like nuclease domain
MAYSGKIPKWWYRRMDKLHSKNYIKNVISDLQTINHELGENYNSFIDWAANRRVNFNPDIIEELNIYKEGDLENKRMYEINVKLWNEIRIKVFKRDDYTCAYCKQKGGILEIDHIIPFSKGGSDELNNLVTSCRKCNRQKKNKSVKDFINWKNNHGKNKND